MIELPEVLTIARQMNEELKGRKIEYGNCGNSPHKFAWYSREREEYEEILAGKTVGEVVGEGNWILASLSPGYALSLGDMGGRIGFLDAAGEALHKPVRELVYRSLKVQHLHPPHTLFWSSPHRQAETLPVRPAFPAPSEKQFMLRRGPAPARGTRSRT